MIDQRSDTGYNWRKKPPIVVPTHEITRICRVCGLQFQTKARNKRRCEACQTQVLRERGRVHDQGRER